MIGFWIYMFIMDMLVPAVMIGFGKYFTKKAPASINAVFGYRTSRSMKNENTWKFAHECIGKIWLRCGIIMAVLSLIALVLLFGRDVDTVGMWGAAISMVQVVVLLLTIIPVERALKRTFDEHGYRKK